MKKGEAEHPHRTEQFASVVLNLDRRSVELRRRVVTTVHLRVAMQEYEPRRREGAKERRSKSCIPFVFPSRLRGSDLCVDRERAMWCYGGPQRISDDPSSSPFAWFGGSSAAGVCGWIARHKGEQGIKGTFLFARRLSAELCQLIAQNRKKVISNTRIRNVPFILFALLHAARTADAVATRHNGFGQLYEITFDCTGPTRTATLLSVWVVLDANPVPQLVTCYPV